MIQGLNLPGTPRATLACRGSQKKKTLDRKLGGPENQPGHDGTGRENLPL